MWRFEDRHGSIWDVALSRESWGVLCALFVPQIDGPVRRLPLEAKTERDALASLDSLEAAEWQTLLDDSKVS